MQHCQRRAGEDSTLYAAVVVGDTQIKVVPGAAVWDTSNDYIQLGISSDFSDLPNFESYFVTAVDTTDANFDLLTISGTITTAQAIGSACGRTFAGSTYVYFIADNQLIDNTKFTNFTVN